MWNASNYANGTFTVSGIGSQINGTADSFGFAYERLSGDGSIVARLVSMQGGSLAGVMIRETLDAGSTNATTADWDARGTSYFDVRATTGGSTTQAGSTSVSLPVWVSLLRSGNAFSSYSSSDGVTWTQMGTTQTVTMAQNVYIGLAVTGGSTSSPATAAFDHVSTTASGMSLPCIASLSATSGDIGNPILITGSGFGSTQGSNQVLLNGAPVTVNFWSTTTISVTIPTGATTGSLWVHEPAAASTSNDSNSVPFTVSSQPVVWGWMDYDLGSEKYTITWDTGSGGGSSGQEKMIYGSSSYANESFVVNGSGLQLYGSSDSSHYLYQQLSGDGSIVARLASVQGASGWWAAAGLMIRETLASSATSVSLVDSPSPGTFGFQVRPATNGNTSQVAALSVTPAYWMKLSRSGNTFSAFTSSDGINWAQLGTSQTISMAQNVYVGLCVTSANNATLAAATFDNVSVSNTSVGSAPVIGTISATTGAAGNQVFISGSGFGNAQGASLVTLNTAPVTINFWSDTFISFTIPTGATSGDLLVSVAPSMNDSNAVWFTVTSEPLPAGWLDRDVGTTNVVGASSYSNGTFTISGSGYQIYSSADAFHFAYRPLNGDGSITARVVSMQAGSGWWAAAGVMIRENMDAGAANAAIVESPQPSNFGFQSRNTTNGYSSQFGSASVAPPYWVKLTRSGSNFSGYTSADGSSWTQVGSTQTITMAQSVYVGLAVESGSASSLATATFDNVSVVSSLQSPTVGTLQPTSGSEGDSIVISGSNFGSAQGNSTVSFGGVRATTVGPWNDTQITATVPTGAATGPMSVVVNGLQSNQNVIFTVNTTISGISPNNGTALSEYQITGSGFGTAQGQSAVTLNGLPSPVLSWGPNSITALAPAGATTGDVVVTVGGIATGGPSFTVTTPPAPVIPSIGSVSPTSGNAGTPVTIQGSGFGSQTTGSIMIGSTLGAVQDWSDTVIHANVSAGSTSGVVQIQQSGYSSNAISFTVTGPNVSGVDTNNGTTGTPVTISGSGFGDSEGTGLVMLGTVPGMVMTWHDTQIQATVGAGSASGVVQVLQNGTWSNSLAFTINTPYVKTISRTSGSPGDMVIVTGSGFGGSQGNGIVWIGNMAGVVSGWNDTTIVANVAANAVSGVVKVQQGGVWSNAVTFTVPVTFGQGIQVFLNPNVLSMVVGDSRTIQAVDSSGNAITGLTWASSDTTIATLSTDDPPIISAVAPGQVTITAGGASVDVTIYAGPTLPTGTVIWSNPGDGSGVSSIVPAVPSSTGVADVFAAQTDGKVQAVTSDGSTVWTASTNGATNLIPDFQGGLVLVTQSSIQRLDGMTGSSSTLYTYTNYNPATPSVVVHTDGTIFTIDGDSVIGIDPATRQSKFTVKMDHSTSTNNGAQNSDTAPTVGSLIVAGDGYAYVPYVYSQASGTSSSEYVYSSSSTQFLSILRVGSGGDYTKIQVKRWNTAANSSQSITDSVPYGYAWCNSVCQQYNSFGGPSTCQANSTNMYFCALNCVPPAANGHCASQPDSVYFICSYTQCTAGVLVQSATSVGPPQVATLITNADQGVLLSFQVQEGLLFTWTQTTCIPSQSCDPHTGNTSTATQNYGTPTSYLATISSGGSVSVAQLNVPSQIGPIQPVLQRADGSYIGTTHTTTSNLMMAFSSSGQQLWSQPNDTPQIATSDGGVIGSSSTRYGSGGNALGHLANLPRFSWKGAYQIGSIDSVTADFDLAGMATTFASVASGNLTGNGFFLAHHTFGLVFCNTGPGGDGPCPSTIDITNMTFAYLPGVSITSDNYTSACDFSRSLTCDSNQAHPDWVSEIKIQALNTYLAAFSTLPAIVRGKYSPVMRYGGTDNPPFEHTVYVDGQWFSQGTGLTQGPTFSWVFYLKLLQAAESILGSQSGSLTPPFSDTNSMVKLLKALGTGIGTTAAHETGWELGFSGYNHFPLQGMNCGPGGSRTCENGINSVYESAGADDWKFLDWNPPINWEPSDRCNLQRYLLNTNLSNNDCQ
jgi:hypothetical protein